MEIAKLKLFISAEEIKQRFAALGLQKSGVLVDIENPLIELQDGRIRVSCTINPVLCARTSAQIEIRLYPQREKGLLVAECKRINAELRIGGVIPYALSQESLQEKIMMAVQRAVQGRAWLKVEGRTLIVDPAAFLSSNKYLTMGSSPSEVLVNSNGVMIEFS